MRIFIENQQSPEGIDVPSPNISWVVEESDLGDSCFVLQTLSCSVTELPGTCLEKTIWAVGDLPYPEHSHLEYAGPDLEESCEYRVDISIQTGAGEPLRATQRFTTGIMTAEAHEWTWVGSEETSPGWLSESRTLPARYLRKTVPLERTPEHAVLHICGLGAFTGTVNGIAISNDVLAPPLSDYERRVYYCTYTVTDALKAGENLFQVVLGNGRYFSPRTHSPTYTKTYGLPSLTCLLVVRYDDGSIVKTSSDISWEVSTGGPIRANNEYDGEIHDARLSSIDPASWRTADPMPRPRGRLESRKQPPMQVIEQLTPEEITPTPRGTYIVDFGQNLVGYCRLHVRGNTGEIVSLKYAETLKTKTELYTDNLRDAKCTDTYILAGAGHEVFEPRFVFHGFRYVEVSGYPGELLPEAIAAMVVHDRLTRTGEASTSSPLFNRILQNALWSIRGNYRSIPTDCPQRDERQGWLGDRAFGSLGETYIYQAHDFYRKWLHDIQDSQDAGGMFSSVAPNYWPMYPIEATWSGTFVSLLNVLHRQYGDTDIVRRMYPSARRWMLLQLSFLENGLYRKDFYGDWCMPPEEAHLIHSLDPERKTAPEVLGTAMILMSLLTLSDLADTLEIPTDASVFLRKHHEIAQAYHEQLFDTDRGCYSNGTVAAQVLSLASGAVPPRERDRVQAFLVERIHRVHEGHISCGIVGIQHLFRALSTIGRSDIACEMILKTGYPGYEYMIEHGATTMWELWNGNTAHPSMNSGNHVMLIGDMITFFFEHLAGIQPAAPGFTGLRLEPQISCGLSEVKAQMQCPHGPVSSHWKRDGQNLVWHILIPPQTQSSVCLPGQHTYEATNTLDGQTHTFSDRTELSPGRWVIRTTTDA